MTGSRKLPTRPTKQEDEQPIPTVWRPVLTDIANAIAEGDYALSRGIATVLQPTPETTDQIRAYLAQYPQKLVHLPEETWNSSVAVWMEDNWEVHVDLWTAEVGRSDLVLSVDVFEEGRGGYRFEVEMVYVP